jgi:hypothetical protein
MIIGITGHRVLPDPAAWEWVQTTLARHIEEATRPLTGMTSLAIGADQMFARIVLGMGGQIEVIVPFFGYERTFERREDLNEYLRLKALASRIQVLNPSDSDDQAYLRAGEHIVDSCNLLITVWDGLPARGLGGTGDVIEYAVKKSKTWIQVNPQTRTTERHEAHHGYRR